MSPTHPSPVGLPSIGDPSPTRTGAARSPRWNRALLLILAPALGCVAPPLTAQEWAPNLTLTTTWQDNATNAKAGADKISGLQLEADVVATHRYSLGRYDSLHPTAHLAAEWWPRFDGLTRGAAGARLGWRHKFGLGPFAPVFSLEGGVDGVAAREAGRRGTSTFVLAGLRKRLTDVAQLGIWHEYSDYSAKRWVFDRSGSETSVQLDRDLTELARLTLRFSYRDGEVLSYATPAPSDAYYDSPSQETIIGTFGRPLAAYVLDAKTIGGRVSLVRAIDTNSAVVLGYEVRRTERKPFRYVNQIVSLAFVNQF